jgi:hypothetical protein
MNELLPNVAGMFGRTVILSASLIHKIERAIRSCRPNILGYCIDKAPIALFAGSQGLLGLTAFAFLPLLDCLT